MNEIEQLRAELAELREAMRLMLAMTMLTIANSGTSASALHTLFANVGAAQKEKERGDTFDAWATAALLALSSEALKRHPTDNAVLEIYQGLRSGNRH